jgi:hypothetical protein
LDSQVISIEISPDDPDHDSYPDTKVTIDQDNLYIFPTVNVDDAGTYLMRVTVTDDDSTTLGTDILFAYFEFSLEI